MAKSYDMEAAKAFIIKLLNMGKGTALATRNAINVVTLPDGRTLDAAFNAWISQQSVPASKPPTSNPAS